MDKHQLRARLLATFLDELEEHAHTLETNTLALEKHPTSPERPEQINALFRAAHSLKGAARSVGVRHIEQRCHQLEEVLSGVRSGAVHLNSELIQRLLTAADELLQLGRELRAQHALAAPPQAAVAPEPLAAPQQTATPQQARTPSSAATAPPASSHHPVQPPISSPISKVDSSSGFVRLSATKLSALLVHSGELLIARQRATNRLQDVAHVRSTMAACASQWRQLEPVLRRGLKGEEPDAPSDLRSATARSVRRTASAVIHIQHALKQLERDLERLEQGLAADHHLIHLAAHPLEQAVREARMAPFGEACQRLERSVRDLAKLANKRIELRFEGGEVELDRAILAQLKDPLLHLVRNAIDHGIEPPEDRLQHQKPAVGRLTLRASLKRGGVEIAIADDGRGLDLNAIRKLARQRQLSVPTDERELLELICSAGFSTAPLVTELSGRGIGLEVVRHAVEALHGQLSVSSRPLQGTEFRLQLPLTLATIRVLMVRAQDQHYAIPSSAVQRLVRVDRSEIGFAEGREVLVTDNKPIPLCSLAHALSGDLPVPASEGDKLLAVVLTAAGRQVAFTVDELLAEDEVVVKNLGRRLRRVPSVYGSTVLPTGKLCLILAATELVAAAARSGSSLIAAPAADTSTHAKRLLVVDDSITTRSLEKSILEHAGYHVSTAPDGAKAWQLIQERPVNLVITDVEMPGVDGFQLTEMIRNSNQFKDLPVILVTALESETDREKGLRVGADAYLPKSTFDQQQLLETVARLIGSES